jgi:hypothetical protein
MPTTAPNHHPDVPLPAGAVEASQWEQRELPYRLINNAGQITTDHENWLDLDASCLRADGTIDEGRIMLPQVYVDGGDRGFNSDQARELASALLEAAAELDRWAGR